MVEAATKNSKAEELVSSIDMGGRAPIGWQRGLIPIIAFVWASFQLYIASGFDYWLQGLTGLPFGVTSNDSRLVHLAFALLLAAFSFPLSKRG